MSQHLSFVMSCRFKKYFQTCTVKYNKQTNKQPFSGTEIMFRVICYAERSEYLTVLLEIFLKKT